MRGSNFIRGVPTGHEKLRFSEENSGNRSHLKTGLRRLEVRHHQESSRGAPGRMWGTTGLSANPMRPKGVESQREAIPPDQLNRNNLPTTLRRASPLVDNWGVDP